MPNSRKEVAEAIMRLTYIEMMEFGDQLVSSMKQDREEGIEVSLENRDYLCERLRWWAEGHLDALEDE